MTFKYSVFPDGTILHYMDGDEYIKETQVFGNLIPAKKYAIELLEADCKQRLLALTKAHAKDIE